MDIIAAIIQVGNRRLLVKDFKTNNEVIVLYPNTRNYKTGTCVRISYDRKETGSIPSIIYATTIWEIECPD